MARFTPRIRKQKAIKRMGQSQQTLQDDSANGDANAETILPEEQRLRRAKRDALAAELKAGQPRFSAKKQKRLEKYIDNKLKKDESLELLKKLGASKIDTTHLRSSRNLGTGRKRNEPTDSYGADPSHREGSVDDLSDWEGFSNSEAEQHSELSESDDVEMTITAQRMQTDPVKKPIASVAAVKQAFGAGLKRPPAQDSQGQPIIQKRQRLNKLVAPDIRQELLEMALEDSTSASDTGSVPSDSEMSDESEDSGDSEEFMDIDGESGPVGHSLFAIPKPAATGPKRGDGVREILEGWSKEASGFENRLSNIEALQQLPDTLKGTRNLGVDRATDTEPLPAELQTSTRHQSRTAFHVQIERPAEIQETRSKLPVVAEEQKIMEAIYNNTVTVICGETGSGKTTQIPQLLFEAGYGSPESTTPGMIGITQPRRVAAITMAKRVAEEMGTHSNKVAYATRFQSTVTKATSIKYMTDGILLKETAVDIALRKYSAIVIDEAHERSINTDTLIGLLSRAAELRETMTDEGIPPLKLIIMSATLVAGDFVTNERLFRKQKPPLVEIEGRQYPVTVHFARRTQDDYLEQAFKKVVNGHSKLPPGSMLVFLTGQAEIAEMSKRLETAFGNKPADDWTDDFHEKYDSDMDPSTLHHQDEDDPSGEAEHEGFDVVEEETNDTLRPKMLPLRAKILPLYAQLQPREQLRVFEQPAEGTRAIILATNVAETSITIPNIRYVFDCGRAKVKKIDPQTGVQTLVTDWISKASATQRLGRAGRTGPGHCYRLYSSAMYESQFIEHAAPEIASVPIEDVVLLLKRMHIPGSISAFPFPSPPDVEAISKAEILLSNLGALGVDRMITSTGEAMSDYPVSPRLARMLILGHQNGLTRLTAALVAALGTPEIFIPEAQLDLHGPAEDTEDKYLTQSAHIAEQDRTVRRKAYNSTQAMLAKSAAGSDALKLLHAFRLYLEAIQSHEASILAPSTRANVTNTPSPETRCAELYMRPRACAEARDLYRQLLRRLSERHPDAGISTSAAPPPQPSAVECGKLRQIVAAGFVDQIAIRLDLLDESERLRLETLHPAHRMARGKKINARNASEVAYAPLYGGEVLAFVHPSSMLAHIDKAAMPPFLVYERLQARPTKQGSMRTSIYPLTPSKATVLREIARGSPLLEWGKPIGKVESMEGRRRRVWVIPSLVNAGERSAKRRIWPLPPAVQVTQKRDTRGEWLEDV